MSTIFDWFFNSLFPTIWAAVSSSWAMSFFWLVNIIGLVIGLVVSSYRR